MVIYNRLTSFQLYDKDNSGMLDDFEARDLALSLCKTSIVGAHGSKGMKEEKTRRLFLKIKVRRLSVTPVLFARSNIDAHMKCPRTTT